MEKKKTKKTLHLYPLHRFGQTHTHTQNKSLKVYQTAVYSAQHLGNFRILRYKHIDMVAQALVGSRETS